MDEQRLSRRRLLTAGAAITAVPVAAAAAALGGGDVPFKEGQANAPAAVDNASGWTWFTDVEATFIDRQLAGAYGRGERWYMQGPWSPGTPTQGYQTRLTPAGMYRAAIKAIDAAVVRESRGGSFAKLAAADQDAFLQRLEKGDVALDGIDAKAFFAQLLQNTMEGFWADPIYGGNKDMAGWKLIGFPGARYDNSEFVSKHGEKYPLPPVGINGRVEWIRS